MNDKVSGKYYRQQLTKAPNPEYKNHFFEIEKVLKTKIVKKKKYLFVKFLYYPNKFNDYVLAEDVKVSTT